MARKPIVNLVDSFKLFTSKFNILSNNVGDMEQLTTYQDSDLVTVINEIEAAFDASAGEILYPNGQDGETSTHLKISTNQSSGQDIDIDAGRDFLVDAVADIELTSVNFEGDYSGNYTSKTDGNVVDSAGGSRTITTTGNHNIDTLGALVVNATGGHIDLNASNNIILDAGADVILDAGDSDIFFRRNGTVFVKTQMGMSGDANLTRQQYQQGGLELDASGIITLDASGDIVLDANDSDIIFKRNGETYVKTQMGMSWDDNTTRVQYSQGTVEFEAANNIIFDATGDIILDADGNDLVFRNGGGADSAQINLSNSGNFTITTPAAFTLDVTGDINIDAGGDNIRLKDGGTTRQEYTLGGTTTIATTGNRTETVTGNVSDSAAGTYSIGATGNMDIDTRGTLDIDTKSTFTVQTGVEGETTASIDLNATGDIYLDAGGDIYLDAGDSDIIFRKNGPANNYARWQMGTEGNPNNFKLNVGKGDFTVDVAGDIVLDAGDSDILFNRNGVEFVKTRMGVAGAPSRVRHVYSQGGVEFEADGDITLDAGGEDIRLKDDGVEFGKLRHIGSSQLGIYSNGILAVSFEDSDAVFNNDVNIENDLDVDRHLNVDGNTTLNGHVDLGNGTGDNISVIGRVDTNIIPDTDGAFNLGSSALEWKHGYFDGTVFADNLDGDSGTIANFNFLNNTMSGTDNIVLDATSDIILDAGDSDVIFKRDGTTIGKAKMGIAGQPSTFALASTGGNFHVDAYGDIVLDAGDSDIIFKRNGTTFLRHRMGVSGADLFTRMEYSQGGVEIDAAGDITLDASGNDIKLKDDGTEFGRFSHIGSNQLGIYSNGNNLALSFSDSDATFNNDVTIKGDLDVDLTLNVDGDTTLNGHVDLGSNGDDNISVLGKFDTNLRPDATNSYNLGTSDLKWRHAYLHQTLFAGNIDVDSADIGDLNFNGNAITNSGGNLIIDVGGDITLNAGGEDIFFNTGDSAAISWNLGRTNPLTNYVQSHNRHLAIGAHKNIYFDADEGKIFFRDSADADRLRIRFDNKLASGTKLETLGGSLTLDAVGDIVLDADGGDVLFKDNSTQFARFENTSGNLILRSGDTTAMTFSGANVTMEGQITLPSGDLDKTTKTVHGCINELDSDLGTRTSLSSFYDGHKHDVITALNRVAARIVDVYDENGTLLNN